MNCWNFKFSIDVLLLQNMVKCGHKIVQILGQFRILSITQVSQNMTCKFSRFDIIPLFNRTFQVLPNIFQLNLSSLFATYQTSKCSQDMVTNFLIFIKQATKQRDNLPHHVIINHVPYFGQNDL